MQSHASLAGRFLELSDLADGLDRTIQDDDEMFRYISQRVGPELAELGYLRSGAEAFRSIENVLDRCGRPLGDCARVLDFACGWGRVLRFLCRALGADRVWAADIEPRAVEFVTERFGAHGIVSTRAADALECTGTFDLIWVGSLFSHLPRSSFGAWLARLWSMVAEGGLLLFSTHGARAMPDTPRDPTGFTFLPSSETEGRLDTADYGTTLIDESAMRQIGAELELPELGWLEAELWGTQDLWVARRADRAPPHLEPGATAFGRIEKAWWPRRDHAWVGGGVRLPVREGRPTVELWLDGQWVAECRVDEGQQHPHPGALVPGMQFFQWYSEGPVAEGDRRPRDVAVTARGATGVRTVLDVVRLVPPDRAR